MSTAAASRNNNAEPGLHGSWVELELNGNRHSQPSQEGPLLVPAADQTNANAALSPKLRALRVVSASAEMAAGLEHAPSSSSIHHGDMERILLDAQHEPSSSSSCDRPRSPDQEEGQITCEVEMPSLGKSQSGGCGPGPAQEEDALLATAAGWVADWSSRPENVPPKEFHFRHPRRSASLSVRKGGAVKKGGLFSSELLRVLIPSLLISHALAFGLGVYLGKRIAAAPTSSY